MTGEKKYQGAPFGTQTSRFDVSGVHPQHKMPGTYTQVPYCKKTNKTENTMRGPGTYSVDSGGFNPAAVAARAQGPNWERAHDTAKYNAIPHMLYRDRWAHKKELAKSMGPGRYEAKDFLAVADQKPSSHRGICQTGESRFPRENTFHSNLPGPGTYGKGGVPWAAKEEKEQKSTSTVGGMDSVPRDYYTEKEAGSGLAPCRYTFASGTEKMLGKKVTTRGPYDLFSGDRHQIPQHVLEKRYRGPGKYDVKSFTDVWDDEHHYKHGEFSKITQYPEQPTERIYVSTLSQCPRPKIEPGPGYYFKNGHLRNGRLRTRSAPPTSKHPFNTSAVRFDKRARLFFNGSASTNPVGIGQYDLNRWNDYQHSPSSASVFTSRTPRLPPKVDDPREKLLDERLRPKGMSATKRLFDAAVLEAPC